MKCLSVTLSLLTLCCTLRTRGSRRLSLWIRWCRTLIRCVFAQRPLLTTFRVSRLNLSIRRYPLSLRCRGRHRRTRQGRRWSTASLHHRHHQHLPPRHLHRRRIHHHHCRRLLLLLLLCRGGAAVAVAVTEERWGPHQ